MIAVRLTVPIGIIRDVRQPSFEYDRPDLVPHHDDRDVHERELEACNTRSVIHDTKLPSIRCCQQSGCCNLPSYLPTQDSDDGYLQRFDARPTPLDTPMVIFTTSHRRRIHYTSTASDRTFSHSRGRIVVMDEDTGATT